MRKQIQVPPFEPATSTAARLLEAASHLKHRPPRQRLRTGFLAPWAERRLAAGLAACSGSKPVTDRCSVLSGLGAVCALWTLLLFLPLMLHAQTTIDWQEDWESPSIQDNWYPDTGIWQMGVPSYGPPVVNGQRAHQGTNCAATILNGNYPDDRQDRLVYYGPDGLGVVIPAASLNPRLRFWHWWSFGVNDFGQVQVSTNNGVTWDSLSPTYSTTGVGWFQVSPISLSAYAGKSVRLGFYFESHYDGVSSGWYVDDITLLATHYVPMITA